MDRTIEMTGSEGQDFWRQILMVLRCGTCGFPVFQVSAKSNFQRIQRCWSPERRWHLLCEVLRSQVTGRQKFIVVAAALRLTWLEDLVGEGSGQSSVARRAYSDWHGKVTGGFHNEQRVSQHIHLAVLNPKHEQQRYCIILYHTVSYCITVSKALHLQQLDALCLHLGVFRRGPGEDEEEEASSAGMAMLTELQKELVEASVQGLC